MKKNIFWLSLFVLSAVVLVVYQPALRLNFYGDDYSFVEKAGRASLGDYLAFYFDPARQDGWYRPLQGMLFGIEWLLFGVNPAGYHLVNVIVHLANTLLLCAIVLRVMRQWRAAFLSALIYCALPLVEVAVFWPGDADFLMALFYLLTIYFWIRYLQTNRRRNYIATFLFFLLALMTKEFGVTLPLVLFLIDRLVLQLGWRGSRAARCPAQRGWAATLSHFRDFASFRDFRAFASFAPFRVLSRYFAFLLVFVIYLPIEYAIQSRSVLTNLYGYGSGSPLANLIGYLTAIAFPWGLPEPLNYVWLVAALGLLSYLIFLKRAYPLLALVLASVLAFLPVIFFPWFLLRYLYLAVMAFAILFAFVLEYALSRLSRPFVLSRFSRPFVLSCFRAFRVLSRPFASFALALILIANGFDIAAGAAEFNELGRQARVPFRDISQRHPAFPDDTLLYFIDPPSPTSELSGMFFTRFGARVSVASNQQNRRADLRAHANTIVIYLDEQNSAREIVVDRNATNQTTPRLPADFAAPIRLEAAEIANSKIKRGEPFAVILYWHALAPLEKEYRVFFEWLDASGKMLASVTQAAREWHVNELIVDARVVALPAELPVANNYRLRVGLIDAQANARVPLSGTDMDGIVIESLSVVE
ncbi:MAG: glycosyltransferase family 39 protein [Chloroflexi bacterium]|nr:glycosyltransferase family 39 protein [Chloroflexota bacterium]